MSGSKGIQFIPNSSENGAGRKECSAFIAKFHLMKKYDIYTSAGSKNIKSKDLFCLYRPTPHYPTFTEAMNDGLDQYGREQETPREKHVICIYLLKFKTISNVGHFHESLRNVHILLNENFHNWNVILLWWCNGWNTMMKKTGPIPVCGVHILVRKSVRRQNSKHTEETCVLKGLGGENKCSGFKIPSCSRGTFSAVFQECQVLNWNLKRRIGEIPSAKSLRFSWLYQVVLLI